MIEATNRSTLGATELQRNVLGEVTLRPAISRDEWTDVLRRLPGGTPFHAWEWLEWIAPHLKCRFLPLVVVDGSRTARGVLPLLLKRRGPVQTGNWVPFPYLGPLVPGELLHATLSELRRLARRERLVNLQIASHPLTGEVEADLASYIAGGFETQLDQTYVIPLRGRDLEDVRKSLSRSTRYKLNRLLTREGLELRPSTPAEITELLPEIESAALARQGLTSPYSDRLGVELATRPPSMPLRITSAVLGGTTVGVVAALGGQVTVGWIGGVLERYQGTDANIALYWDVIAWAHAIGSDYMDLVGIPTPGIGEFKRQFGGELNSYPVGRRGSRLYRSLALARPSGSVAS